jgi:hypothetical protein
MISCFSNLAEPIPKYAEKEKKVHEKGREGRDGGKF